MDIKMNSNHNPIWKKIKIFTKMNFIIADLEIWNKKKILFYFFQLINKI